jgi:hypothetical protein
MKLLTLLLYVTTLISCLNIDSTLSFNSYTLTSSELSIQIPTYWLSNYSNSIPFNDGIIDIEQTYNSFNLYIHFYDTIINVDIDNIREELSKQLIGYSFLQDNSIILPKVEDRQLVIYFNTVVSYVDQNHQFSPLFLPYLLNSTYWNFNFINDNNDEILAIYYLLNNNTYSLALFSQPLRGIANLKIPLLDILNNNIIGLLLIY